MAVISITIERSSEEVVSGIPRSVTIETNIPSTIFYTLDGSDPTISSNIYTSTLYFSAEQLSVTLKVFATNGVDSSTIIANTYSTNILHNARIPHASISGLSSPPFTSLFPFGSNFQDNRGQFQTNAQSGVNVDALDQPGTFLGFDGSGNPAGKIDSETPYQDYKFVFTTSDREGQTGHGIGNFPSETKVIKKQYPDEYRPEESSQNDKLFNPRAMVIFQNSSLDDPTDPPSINKQFFSLQNPEIVKDGSFFYNVGPENNQTSGSFLRSHFNPRTQEMTYYYYDSSVNRWLISTQPYQPSNNGIGNLSDSVVFPRVNSGAGVVYAWKYPTQRRILF